MAHPNSPKVLRVALVVDDKVTDELHQTAAGPVRIGRGLRNTLVVHDGHERSVDTRRRAPIWLVIGVVMFLAGMMIFGSQLVEYRAEQAELAAELETNPDAGIENFRQTADPTAWYGVAFILLGLVPLISGGISLMDEPRDRAPAKKGRPAPAAVRMFDYRNGAYWLDLPKDAKGKVSLGKKAYTVGKLRKKFGGGRVRVKLSPKAKGKVQLGQTWILFQFDKPAKVAPRGPLPTGMGAAALPLAAAVPITLLTALILAGLFFAVGPALFLVAALLLPFIIVVFSPLEGVAYMISAVLLGGLFVYTALIAEPGDKAVVSQRMRDITGTSFADEKEEEEPVEEEDEEEEKILEQEDEDKVKEVKEVDPDRIVATKPQKFSKAAENKARGVGVARVLGTYGGPGEGTVFDVIEGTENNLGDLFDKGMTTTVMADGGDISAFVAGGEGITANGAAVRSGGLKTTDDQPELEDKSKKERRIKGKVKSATNEIYGDVDGRAVKAVIRRKMGALQSCYEKQLRTAPDLKGKVSFTITISIQGRVVKVDIEEDTLGNSAVLSCAKAKIKNWRFPVEGADEASEVNFSVVFSGA